MMDRRSKCKFNRRHNGGLSSFVWTLAIVNTLSSGVLSSSSRPQDNNENWIDPSTPSEARTIRAMDGRQLSLVFSDEFMEPGRSFADGADTRWTSEDRPGVTNAGLQYYNSSHVLTENGALVIQTTRSNANWTEYDPNNGKMYDFSRLYQSGMVTTWNKFCFTSGVIEISFQLPGSPLRGGLWPAFWMLGNLVRPNYMESSDGVWPYSYDECGTSEEAQEVLQAQLYHKCRMGKHGRGSPEIDIIEAQPGDFTLVYENVKYVNNRTQTYSVERPLMSSSLQVSPGVHKALRPQTPDLPLPGQWYADLYPMGGRAYNFEGLPQGNNTKKNQTKVVNTTLVPHRMLNNYWYGQPINEEPEIWQDGLSCNWHHDASFYTQQTVLRTEWQTGKDDGYVRWYYGDEMIYEVTAEMLKRRPGASDAIPQIPYEAMYLILNTDVSPRWGWNGCNPNDPCLAVTGLCSAQGELTCLDCGNPDCLRCPDTTAWLGEFCQDVSPEQPAEFKIDFIRVYQDTTDATHTLGCDPPEYPTRQIIEENWEKFTFNSWITKEPLKMVQHGGGFCESNADCGAVTTMEQELETEGGDNNTSDESVDAFQSELSAAQQRDSKCVKGRCVCPDFEWTGPSCHSPCVGPYARCTKSGGTISRASSSFWMFTVLTSLWTISFVVWG